MSEQTPIDSEDSEPSYEDKEFERLIHDALLHKGWTVPYTAEDAPAAIAASPREYIPPVNVQAILSRGRIRKMPVGSLEDVREAVARARQEQPAWEALSFRERRHILLNVRRLVLHDMEDIARLISRETGKSVAEIVDDEIKPTLELIRGFARLTERLLKFEMNKVRRYGLAGRPPDLSYCPLGVIGIISSRHCPWALPVSQIVMALMTGNAVVFKPSKLTPFAGLKIEDVFMRAGLPEGILQVVTGDGLTSQALAEAGVDKYFFTGSVAAARRVAESAAKHPTPVVFKLNGKVPVIVLEDADVEAAAAAVVETVIANAGQDNVPIERCYVHRSIAPQFISHVSERIQHLRRGERRDASGGIVGLGETDVRWHVEERIRDAVGRGARVLAGGRRRHSPSGFIYEPTLLVDVDHSMPIVYEETLGLALSIIRYETEDEAVRLVNDGAPSPRAIIWTRDVERGWHLARSIQAGTVSVNEMRDTGGATPASREGMKYGAWERTYSQLGLADFVSPQHHLPRAAGEHSTPTPDSRGFAYVPHTACLLLALGGYLLYKYRQSNQSCT